MPSLVSIRGCATLKVSPQGDVLVDFADGTSTPLGAEFLKAHRDDNGNEPCRLSGLKRQIADAKRQTRAARPVPLHQLGIHITARFISYRDGPPNSANEAANRIELHQIWNPANRLSFQKLPTMSGVSWQKDWH
jgi:hypothetical protein